MKAAFTAAGAVMKAALVAALAEIERQLASRTPVVRVIIDAEGTELRRIVRGTFQGAPQE